MLTFLIVALRWDGLERNVAVALYLFRLVGFLVFELTGARMTLVLFPNVFEIWFLVVAGLHARGMKLRRRHRSSSRCSRQRSSSRNSRNGPSTARGCSTT